MIELSFGRLGLSYTNLIVIGMLLAASLLSLRKRQPVEVLPVSVSQELKGLAILSIVLAHISYMLVTEKRYLFPLSNAAGVGVDLFLFMSGFGLTAGMLKQRVAPLEFYRRRLIRIFVPLWVVVVGLFCADTLFLQRDYPLSYVLRSLLGWFPTASGANDVDSPFWYISWLMMFYLLLPWLFSESRPWLTAMMLAIVANVVAFADPFGLQVNWLYRLHTMAFSIGMVGAWWVHGRTRSIHHRLARLKLIRDNLHPLWRYPLLLMLAWTGAYFAHSNDANSWPLVARSLYAIDVDANAVVGQCTSLIAMSAVMCLFCLKRVESRFLYLFGVYSFETYLIHWPLMSRYDVFFHQAPAWLAPILWLTAFIVLGWILQAITAPLSRWFDCNLQRAHDVEMQNTARPRVG